jgi:acyl-CoA reductase-like NAD-dependent aldehyde dehydrogenase
LVGIFTSKFAFCKKGVPKDVFVPVIGKGDIGSQLLQQDIDGVFFTGSLETGKKIASAVAPKMIKAS